MKAILTQTAIALALLAPATASAVNLTGLWVGSGYSCGTSRFDELMRIDQSADSFTASKLTGDACVPAGGPSFFGKLSGNTTSACTIVLGSTSCPACSSAACTVEIIDDKSFRIPSHGLTFTRSSTPLNVELTLSGCTTCRTGDRLTVKARVNNLDTREAKVEVKVGLRKPDGTPSSLLGQYLELTLTPSLDATYTVYDAPLPATMQSGIWTFEAALLEPELGLTLNRAATTFTLTP